MPVDIHPKEKVSGVEIILTRLHAGGKFNDKTYQHAADCMVSACVGGECAFQAFGVLGAPRRQGVQHQLRGRRDQVQARSGGRCSESKTGTTIRFLARSEVFRHRKFAIPKLKQVLRAKAVLCPNLRVTLSNEFTGEKDEWLYTGGLHQYLAEELGKGEWLPAAEPFMANATSRAARSIGPSPGVLESEHAVAESYVNLIPTVEGGTHVNGLRAGVADRGARVLRIPQLGAARPEAHA